MQKFKYLNKNKLNSLPKTAGVYAFCSTRRGGQKGEFLYIGKAINIKNRVKNHFQQPIFKDSAFIIPKTDKLGYIKTNSEIEALLMEAELIKKHRPKHNVIWKDDKNFTYVAITKEKFPRVFLVHQLQTINYKLQTEYIGPFVDGKAIRQTLKILRRTFPFRTCKTLPKKKCLFYDLKLCPAPCEKEYQNIEISKYQKEYKQNINNLIKILRGKKQQVLKNLKKEMQEASKSQNFEKASRVRDQMFALENVFQNAHIIKDVPKRELNWPETEKKLKALLGLRGKIKRLEGYDVSNIQGKEAAGSMVVFENGRKNKKEYKRFKIKTVQGANDVAMLKEILTRRFSHPEWGKPQIILIDGGKAQLNVAIKCLTPEVKHIYTIKVIALAKKKNELFIEGGDKPVLLKNLPSEISNLILQTRDEAHSFAIAYHKKLRSRDFLKN